MKMFVPFEKVEELDDGTIRVSGIASTESVDSHGEVVKAAAMRAAIPDYMAFGGTGALREMHQAIAAGVVLKAEVNDQGQTHIESHVVDANSVKKVKAGVFKGFSIGGKALKKSGKDIEALALREISLVDRPSNPDAVFTLMKMDGEEAADGDRSDEGDVQKSLYTTSRLAELLASLKNLESSDSYEGNGGPTPVTASIKSACKALSAALVASASHETSKVDDDMDLKKLADDTGAIAKAVTGLSEAMTKQSDDLQKRFDTQDAALKSLTERLEKVEATPAATSTTVKTVDKETETGGGGAMSKADVDAALAKMSPEERAHIVMKAALANGVSVGAARA